jgi:hypothetical protein
MDSPGGKYVCLSEQSIKSADTIGQNNADLLFEVRVEVPMVGTEEMVAQFASNLKNTTWTLPLP